MNLSCIKIALLTTLTAALIACGGGSKGDNNSAELDTTIIPEQANAIGFYDQQFGGEKRTLRNDLNGELQGEVQFMQSHNVRPNGNFQRDAGDETSSIYNPRLVALRESLMFFTPTHLENSALKNIVSIDAELRINGEVQTTLSMLHPNDIYEADYNGTYNVVFSNYAWSTTLPWQHVKNGLSVRFIVNKHSNLEKTGVLTASDIDIGKATQVIFQSLRLGMLTNADTSQGHYTLNNPIMAATDYFQTIPTSRLIMGSYADMQLDKVIVRSGVIYDEVSATEGDIYSGDMREDVAKAQVSTGINLANFGITSNNMHQRYPHLFKQTTNHHAWGNYKNGRRQHGLSGGNGIGTLVDSRGNEASHEWGHGYGIGHYPGKNLTDDQRFQAHHSDSGWGYIAHRNRLRDNLIDNREATEPQPPTFHLDGKIPYGRDAMSGGSGNTELSAYTHHTAFSARLIQKHLEQYPLPTTNFASGYKKWSEELGQYQEYTYPENDSRLAAKEVGVAVATLLGGYDPDSTNYGNNAVIYPVFHGNYGNVFDLPEPDLTLFENGLLVDQCWVNISNAQGDIKLVSVAANRHSNNSINQLHINLKAEFRPTLAILNCRRNGVDHELTRTVFDGQIQQLPPVAIVGQDAEFKQLMGVELTQLSELFESQADAQLINLTSSQKSQLDSYTPTEVQSIFSALAYSSYQKYKSIQTTLDQLEILLAKMTKEGLSNTEQAVKVRELLSNNELLAANLKLPSAGKFIEGPKYFGMVNTDNFITPADSEEQASSWIMSSQGRIHLADQPWLCVMPSSGGLVADQCSISNNKQSWDHTDETALRNPAMNKCIDFDSANGKLIMWGCHYRWNQQWSLPAISNNPLLVLLDAAMIKRLYELLAINSKQ